MSAIADSHLSNKDLEPTGPEQRTWGTYHLAALWIGLSIVITTYTLAAGLIAAGMEWWQGLFTVALGNLLVLIPILLNSHPGTKYGIPFPVLVRSSFGIRGANVAAMARALVACGWFGIQTWIGALAVDTLMATLWHGWGDLGGHKAIAFGAFWLVEVAIILRGIEGIRWLERTAAPLLIGGSAALLIWATVRFTLTSSTDPIRGIHVRHLRRLRTHRHARSDSQRGCTCDDARPRTSWSRRRGVLLGPASRTRS